MLKHLTMNRLATLLLASTFLTLPACERLDGIKQQVQGAGPSSGISENHGLSVETLREIQGLVDQKVNERVNAEVKKQLGEQIKLIENKIVMPSSSVSSVGAPSSSSGQDNNSDFRKGFSEVAAKAVPAVVNVLTTQVIDQKQNDMKMGQGMGGMGPGMPLEELFKDFFEQAEKPKRVQSVGSGFFVKVTDKDAYIVTNNHVVADAKKITIILADKTEVDAMLHATDDRTDLAVLRIKLDNLPTEKRKITSLDWGNSDDAKVGQFVLAVGNPFGLGSTVTSGIVSGKGRDIVLRAKNKATDLVDDFIQHDASINMGNSGGVLLNLDGKVIGINTAIFSPSGGSIGIGFAIPSSLAKATVDQLIEFGRTKRGWLGVSIFPVSAEYAEALGMGDMRGGIVKGVNKDSPAEKAGFKENDIIIDFDGKKLGDSQRLSRVVGDTPVGKTVPVKILRDNKEMILNVTLADFPANLTMDDATKQTIQTPPEKVTEVLGMGLVDLPKAMMEKSPHASPDEPSVKGGALIVDVKENSSAEDSGLKKGDIISEVSMKPITKPEEVSSLINEIRKDPKRPSVLLRVIRRGMPPQYVAVQFKSITETATDNAKESPKSGAIPSDKEGASKDKTSDKKDEKSVDKKDDKSSEKTDKKSENSVEKDKMIAKDKPEKHNAKDH